MSIRGADDETGYVQETTVSMWGGDVARGAFITFLPISLVISQGWGLIDLPRRAAFSPALPSDCFAIDFPRRAISPSECLRNRYTSLQGE